MSITPLEEVLEKISEIVVIWNNGQYKDLFEMNRQLSSNMFFLAHHQVEAKKEWMFKYYNCNEGSNAAREKWADMQVPELYQCRKIYDAAKGVSISIQNELKLN